MTFVKIATYGQRLARKKRRQQQKASRNINRIVIARKKSHKR